MPLLPSVLAALRGEALSCAAAAEAEGFFFFFLGGAGGWVSEFIGDYGRIGVIRGLFGKKGLAFRIQGFWF